MNKCCCKGCENRVVGCHSTCEQYAAYRKDIDEVREETKKQNQIDGALNRYNKEKKKSINKDFRKRG